MKCINMSAMCVCVCVCPRVVRECQKQIGNNFRIYVKIIKCLPPHNGQFKSISSERMPCRSPNYTLTSEPDIFVFAFSLLLLLFEYIGLYGMNAHFLIFFSCYFCRHCGICSEIWIMYCTHSNKKRIFPNAVCQSAGMAFFSLFFFICAEFAQAQRYCSKYGILCLDWWYEFKLCWICCNARCVCAAVLLVSRRMSAVHTTSV